MADLKKIANPAPLGFAAFGMTTILLNLHNAGFFGLGAMLFAMVFFYGGLAQVIAGILEFKNGNTFGLLAFTSYGFLFKPAGFVGQPPAIAWAEAPSATAMGFYLLCGEFSPCLCFLARFAQTKFYSLSLLFLPCFSSFWLYLILSELF